MTILVKDTKKHTPVKSKSNIEAPCKPSKNQPGIGAVVFWNENLQISTKLYKRKIVIIRTIL